MAAEVTGMSRQESPGLLTQEGHRSALKSVFVNTVSAAQTRGIKPGERDLLRWSRRRGLWRGPCDLCDQESGCILARSSPTWHRDAVLAGHAPGEQGMVSNHALHGWVPRHPRGQHRQKGHPAAGLGF